MYIWVKSCVNYLKLIGDDEDNGFVVIVRILFSSKKVDIFEKLFNFHRRKCQFLEKNSTIQKSNSENKKVVVFILVVKMTELW